MTQLDPISTAGKIFQHVLTMPGLAQRCARTAKIAPGDDNAWLDHAKQGAASRYNLYGATEARPLDIALASEALRDHYIAMARTHH
jgi:hypothetical protein